MQHLSKYSKWFLDPLSGSEPKVYWKSLKNNGFHVCGVFLCVVFLMMGGVSFAQNPDIEVKPISLNHSYSSEIAPFFKDSILYFSSNRKTSIVKSVLDQNSEPLYHIFYSRLKKSGAWTPARLWYPHLQSPMNNGQICFSPSGKEAFITQSLSSDYKLGRKQSTINQLGIFSARLNGDAWELSGPMDFNSSLNSNPYSCGQVSLSPDGNTLFFASDMNRGYGKTDIYFCRLENGHWSEPVNMGNTINTPGNEVFPFYHPSGKLFFSSDGHAGSGGLDILYSLQNGSNWLDPVLLDKPINSESDDYACYIMPDENMGFFTSNRDRSDNIYQFNLLFPAFEQCNPQVEDNYCYTFSENGPYKSDTLPFIYRWEFGDGNLARGLEVDHCFEGPGSYRIKLSAVDSVLNVDMMVVAEYELNLVKTEQVYITSPDTVKVGESVRLDALKSYFNSIQPVEFYWNLGDGTKEKGVTILHVFRKKGVYTVTCGTVARESNLLKFCSTKEIVVIE